MDNWSLVSKIIVQIKFDLKPGNEEFAFIDMNIKWVFLERILHLNI